MREPASRFFAVQRSLTVAALYKDARQQVVKDARALSWAAHLATILGNALVELDSDAAEDALGHKDGINHFIIAALHAVTNAFGQRIGGPAFKDAKRVAQEVQHAATSAPHLLELWNEVRTFRSLPPPPPPYQTANMMPVATSAQLIRELGHNRLHLVDAEATQMVTSATRHLRVTQLQHVAALVGFARDLATDKVSAARAMMIARRIMGETPSATETTGEPKEEEEEVEEEEEEERTPLTLTDAEATLEELRRTVGRVAVINICRRAAEVARLRHALLRARYDAYRRGKQAAPGTSEATAAERAVRTTDARLHAWERQWQAVWPPARIVTLTTLEALRAAAVQLGPEWAEGWAHVRLSLHVELPTGPCSSAYVAHCLAAACAEHATR